MKKTTLLFLAALMISLSSLAQVSENWCGTDKAEADYGKAHPGYLIEKQQLEMQLQAIDKAAYKNGSQPKTTGTVYIIPVVFHIVHDSGVSNLSDAQVYSAVQTINEDFRKRNNDTSATISIFKGIAADCEIEVRLATIDPNGNCTKGIDRIYDPTGANNGAKPNQWPPSKYLNIWSVASLTTAGVAGYTNGPSSGSSAGILLRHTYIGNIGTGTDHRRHALPHEVGHYFSLNHTWGGSNTPEVACGDDGVTDTPVTMGHTSSHCILNDAKCTAGVVENVQNFMEYSYCYTMFTEGQKTRMRSAIASSTYLNTLWQNSNLVATGTDGNPALCQADYTISTDTLCVGSPLVYTDLSYNGVPTTWNWTFPGGTPATSTLSSPSVVYNTPGIYGATLTVGNSTGSKTVTRTSGVIVRGPIGMQYSQNFDSYTFPGPDFTIVNRDKGVTWKSTTGAAFSGTTSVYIDNSSNPVGQVDDMIGPGVNMSSLISPEFNFKVAYAQKTTSTFDKLQVYLSTDCGLSWAQRYLKAGSSLATAPVTSGTFVPTITQWRKEVVPLSSTFTSKQDMMFMFRFTGAGGGDIYIDDINLVEANGIKEDEFGNKIGLSIYPNPSEENAVISFHLEEKKNVIVNVYDVLGRDMATVANKEMTAGDYSLPVSKEALGLNPGIYFVKLFLDNSKYYTQKMVIE